MNKMSEGPPARAGSDREAPRILGVFAAWRLEAYGYTLVAVYAAFFLYVYWYGMWLVNSSGVPVYRDFTNMFVAGLQALHGEAASAYDPAEHVKLQEALVGAGHFTFSVWPYPPTYFLILAPLAMLPYAAALLTWDFLTLASCATVVYLIVRRWPAIALVLASPFTAWNFLFGQSGFLTASLVGAALLALDRRPVVAGMFIACLTYKPQLGILFPVALVAGRQWRAFTSAVVATVCLVGASVSVFGAASWGAFPQALVVTTDVDVSAGRDSPFGSIQTVYGLIRALRGGAASALLVQGATTLAVAIIVWLVWRSKVRYSLKAATLSAAALLATPYAYAYELAAVAVPVAFLAKDQIGYGLLKGEQTAVLAMFVASLSIIPTGGQAPVGPLILLALLGLILRRAVCLGSNLFP
jgi:arabinofuranan 3-O-arabinosyltransferase